MVTQAAWGADYDVCACRKIAAFTAHIHTTNTSGDTSTGFAVEPFQFFRNLDSQLTGWRNTQCKRFVRTAHTLFITQQFRRNSDAECNCFTRACLSRNQKVFAFQFFIKNGCLDRG